MLLLSNRIINSISQYLFLIYMFYKMSKGQGSMFKAKWECKLKSLVIIGMLLTILTMIKLITDAIIDENS